MLDASAGQVLAESLDDSRAQAMRFAERAAWTYRVPHGERVATRTAVLWRKSLCVLNALRIDD